MNRRVFLGRRVFLRHCAGGVLGAVFTASAAVADSFQSSVVAQLRGQGYREINVETTLLGRVRIVAARSGASREIILNPRTGEILRDVVLAEDGRVAPEIAGSEDLGSEDSGTPSAGDNPEPEPEPEPEQEKEKEKEKESEGSGGKGSGNGGGGEHGNEN